MITLKVKENSKQAKAFIELARTLKFVEFLNSDVESPYNKDFVDEIKRREKNWKNKKVEEILKDKNLTKKEKAFYKKFVRAVDEAREIEAGNVKGIPLEKTLNEI